MTRADFSTSPFTCPSCVKKIETNVGKMAGVNDVRVLFNSNKVKVNFDEAGVTADDISHVITKLGYQVESVKLS